MSFGGPGRNLPLLLFGIQYSYVEETTEPLYRCVYCSMYTVYTVPVYVNPWNCTVKNVGENLCTEKACLFTYVLVSLFYMPPLSTEAKCRTETVEFTKLSA